MKKSIFIVFISGLAWGLYWVLTDMRVYLPPETGFLWLVPSVKILLIKAFTAEFVVFSIWLLSGYTGRNFKKDARYYLPALILFVSLGQFLPPSNRLSYFPYFLVHDLGPFLPLLVICTTLYLKLKTRIPVLWKRLNNKIELYSAKKLACFIFFITLIVYVFFSLRLVPVNSPKDQRYYLLTGDEPHYLLVTHSLVFDKDINLHNNVEQEDSRLYYDRGINGLSGGVELFGRFARGRMFTAKEEYWRKKRYSLIKPGLPVLLGPCYFIGAGWDGRVRLTTVLFLNLIASLLAINIFLLSYNTVKDKSASFIISSFAALSMPFLFYSGRIYTEIPAALLLIYSFRKIHEKSFNNFFNVLLTGLCIGYLPWLHEKYLLFTGLLIVFFLFQWRRYNKRVWVLSTVIAILSLSIGLQMRYYYLLFGVPYPVNMHPGFCITGFIKGFLGLWLDEAHGLLPYTPVYMISLSGIVLIFKLKNRHFLWLPVFAFSFLLCASCFIQWWGGFCPPGRYVLLSLPFLVPLIVYGYKEVSSNSFKAITIILGIIGAAIGIGSMLAPGRLYRHIHPFIHYTEKISILGIFPNVSELNSQQYRLTAVWILFITLFMVFYIKPVKTGRRFRHWTGAYCVIISGLFILNLVQIRAPEELTEKDKLIVYKKISSGNYHAIYTGGARLLASPPVINYEAENLLTDKRNIVPDENAGNKKAVLARVNETEPDYIIYGPYETFPPGAYQISFRMKISDKKEQNAVAVIDVVSGKGTITHGKREVMAVDFIKTGQYYNITFLFNLSDEVSDIEFRVFFTGQTDIWIDKVKLTPVEKSQTI